MVVRLVAAVGVPAVDRGWRGSASRSAGLAGPGRTWARGRRYRGSADATGTGAGERDAGHERPRRRLRPSAEAVGSTSTAASAPTLEDAGVSTAIYGLADTGSVVLAAAPDEPRARSLLPDVHVTLLREDRILPGLAELFAALGADLPSALAIVTGPSRSADIEQKLAVGVHGPGEVHVVLLSADQAR